MNENDSSFNEEEEGKDTAPLAPRPGEYYFTANGCMVFKAEYHLRRGYCCGNECRHCPFRG